MAKKTTSPAASNTTATQASSPQTWTGVANKLEADLARAASAARTREAEFVHILRERFTAAGGCTVCGGRGWIVTWDTLDSLSGCYAEYGECTDKKCTPETRAASGFDPYYSKYDSNRGLKNPVTSHPEYRSFMGMELAAVSDLKRKLEIAKEESELRRGREVIVARGRKVPIGTRGIIAFIHNNGGILIKPRETWQDRNSPGTWVNSYNLEVVISGHLYLPSLIYIFQVSSAWVLHG